MLHSTDTWDLDEIIELLITLSNWTQSKLTKVFLCSFSKLNEARSSCLPGSIGVSEDRVDDFVPNPSILVTS